MTIKDHEAELLLRHVTIKDREDRFIEKFKKEIGALSYEAELLLRHGFSTGAHEMAVIGYDQGVTDQRDNVLFAIGAEPLKKSRPQP